MLLVGRSVAASRWTTGRLESRCASALGAADGADLPNRARIMGCDPARSRRPMP